ncbi:hypothetical protein BH18THE2_BH18THE2_06470 [soil metagenome]
MKYDLDDNECMMPIQKYIYHYQDDNWLELRKKLRTDVPFLKS